MPIIVNYTSTIVFDNYRHLCEFWNAPVRIKEKHVWKTKRQRIEEYYMGGGRNKWGKSILIRTIELRQALSQNGQSAQFCFPPKGCWRLNQRAITVPSLLKKWEQYPALIRERARVLKWRPVIAKEVSVTQSLSLYLCRYLRGRGGGIKQRKRA